MRGVLLFTALCATVAALSVLPPELGRWVALGLLVLVALTPAVGRRWHVQAGAEDTVKPREERGA